MDDQPGLPARGVPTGSPPEDRAGDEAWFTSVFDTHAAQVHRHLWRRGAGPDAEDLTADVLATAWRRRAQVPRDAVLPWLYRTAGFVLANHRRKVRPIPVAEVPEAADPSDPMLRVIRDDRVRRSLVALSDRDREILLLIGWEGVSGPELATVLGTSRSGADAAVSRARARWRTAWAAAGEGV